MRSLYVGVALAALGTLLLAYVAFLVISDQVTRTYLDPVFVATDQLELEDAVDAWNTGGRRTASASMVRLDRLFGPSHYLVDSHGIDVVSGEDRSALLPNSPATLSRGFMHGVFVVTHKSSDGRFWLIAANPRRTEGPSFLPYYLIPIGVTAVFCWLAAVGVIWPLRTLSENIRKFGQGELSVRSKFRRKDEIGALARSFDEMADRLEKLIISKRRLLEDVSHELRSPLARLKLAVKLARGSGDAKAALDRVERDVDRIARLTSEIVELNRIEGDSQSEKMLPVNITELVGEVVGDCRAESAGEIRVDRQFTGDVLGNRELLQRAVENVLRNAIRHSPGQMPIDLAINARADGVTISIRDYGLGVPDAMLAQIFEPFFRADESREAARGGVGLGLSIAKRAVEVHRGTIAAQNAHPGLRVLITLP